MAEGREHESIQREFKKCNENNSFGLPNGTVTVDAIHPRFREHYLTSKSTSTSDVAYCRACNEIFDKGTRAVREHFNKEVRHDSLPCVYCNGPVYEYVVGPRKFIFHQCNTSKDSGKKNEISDEQRQSKPVETKMKFNPETFLNYTEEITKPGNV